MISSNKIYMLPFFCWIITRTSSWALCVCVSYSIIPYVLAPPWAKIDFNKRVGQGEGREWQTYYSLVSPVFWLLRSRGAFCACVVSPLPQGGDICDLLIFHSRFPGGSVVKNLRANAGDTGSIPGSGRSPRGRNGNSFQYSCLENPMDRRARWAGYSPYDRRMGNDWSHTIFYSNRS